MNITREEFADKGSERIVISCILQYPDLIVDVEAKLGEVDFLSPYHRAIYVVLKSLYKQGVKQFDLLSVMDEAEKRSLKPTIGSGDYINALFSAVISPGNITVFVNKVLDASLKYKLYLVSQEAQQDVISNAPSQGESVGANYLISKAESRLLDIVLQQNSVEDAEDVADGLEELVQERLDNPVDVLGYSTGFPLLDKKINGLCPKTLTVVAARPKCGKSTLLTNMAARVAYFGGDPVLYIDTEMSTVEMRFRLLSLLSGVPHRLIVNGTFGSNNLYLTNVRKALTIIKKGKILHKYMPGYTIDTVKSQVRKSKLRDGIRAFFFDYIKLPEVTSDTGMKEYQLLGNVATALKDLAGRLDIPVVAAAQVKRSERGVEKSRIGDQDVADSDRLSRYCNNLLAISLLVVLIESKCY
jgi:replicative DNA helicase